MTTTSKPLRWARISYFMFRQSLRCSKFEEVFISLNQLQQNLQLVLELFLVYPCDSGTSIRPVWNFYFFKYSLLKRKNLGWVSYNFAPHYCQMFVCRGDMESMLTVIRAGLIAHFAFFFFFSRKQRRNHSSSAKHRVTCSELERLI